MTTFNISVTEEQANLVNSLMNKFGYANRSEFFRSLLRTIAHKPETMSQAGEFSLRPTPPGQKVSEVMDGFKKTGLYSEQFLKDVEAGLRASDSFIAD